MQFVITIEGKEAVADKTIWFSKFRIEAFIKMYQAAEKAPNSVGNKANTLVQVNQSQNQLIIEIYSFLTG